MCSTFFLRAGQTRDTRRVVRHQTRNDAADTEAICEAVARALNAVRAGEGRRAAIRVDAASGVQPSGLATHDAGQCIVRSHGRIRHYCTAESRACQDPDEDNGIIPGRSR